MIKVNTYSFLVGCGEHLIKTLLAKVCAEKAQDRYVQSSAFKAIIILKTSLFYQALNIKLRFHCQVVNATKC